MTAGSASAAPAGATAGALSARAPLLTVDRVTKVFGRDVVALEGMHLDVRLGDFISLLGPSGCGKSTALRLIAGLSHPTAGRIRWEGQGGREDLSVVFQEPKVTI